MARFKPGQSGNPGGRPKVPEHILELRRLNQYELERIINCFLFAPVSELKRVTENKESTSVEALVASIILSAIARGDQMRLDFILNRMIGKVQDKVEVVTPKPFVIHRQDGSQVELGAMVEKEEE